MDKEQHRVAKALLVAGTQAGRSWQTAAAQAGLSIISQMPTSFGELSDSEGKQRLQMVGKEQLYPL